MRLTCPCCGGLFSIEAALADAQARQAVAAALQLPAGLGDRVLRYLGLFRPPERGLSWDKATRLLVELHDAIRAAQVTRHGRDWPAPQDYWRMALDQMLDARPTLTLPLKTHGYLFEIVVGIAQKAEARREQAEEEQRKKPRYGAETGIQPLSALLETADCGAELPDNGNNPPAVEEIDATADRPARIPPPPELRELLARLKGRMQMPVPSTDSPVDAHEPPGSLS